MRLPSFTTAGAPLLQLVFALLSIPAGAAHAFRGADVPPPTPEAVRAANPASTSQAARERAADAALTLREGRLTAVDPAAGRIDIDGTAFRWIEGRSRVYRRGVSVDASALTAGQPVAFAISNPRAADAARALAERDTIAVIHVR